MAKIVLAGRSDCPYFARCELLGDRLAKNLKKFRLHKIVIQPEQWEKWLTKTCSERGWNFTKSPIIWRELIDRGGKGVLIGGANDFQEYAKAYYDVESEMNSFDMLTVSAENKMTKDAHDEEERAFNALSQPVHVCITNAASTTCYYLLKMLSSGQILGPDIELTIRLLVLPAQDVDQVRGVAMEAEDLAHGLLREVKIFTDPEEAFEDCSYIIILDNIHKTGMEAVKDWLDRNAEFFTNYASIINRKALKTCKILLCGNGPVNFNAMIMMKNAPVISKKNIVAVASVVENQAKAVVAEKLNVNPAGVTNLVVWGNINGKRYFDVTNCRVHGYSGAVTGPHWYSVSGMEMIHDNRWIAKELPWLVSSRYHKVSEALGRQTNLSTANAIATTLQLWCRGSPDSQFFSLGVHSEGWYAVPKGIFFSFPVTMDPKGYWNVVQDIEVTQETKDSISDAIAEIMSHMHLHTGESEVPESSISVPSFILGNSFLNSRDAVSDGETAEHDTVSPETPADLLTSSKRDPDETSQDENIQTLQDENIHTLQDEALETETALSKEQSSEFRQESQETTAPQFDISAVQDGSPPQNDDTLPLQDGTVPLQDDTVLLKDDTVAPE